MGHLRAILVPGYPDLQLIDGAASVLIVLLAVGIHVPLALAGALGTIRMHSDVFCLCAAVL